MIRIPIAGQDHHHGLAGEDQALGTMEVEAATFLPEAVAVVAECLVVQLVDRAVAEEPEVAINFKNNLACAL